MTRNLHSQQPNSTHDGLRLHQTYKHKSKVFKPQDIFKMCGQMSTDSGSTKHKHMNYLLSSIEDLLPHLSRVASLISDEVEAGGNVLIHCVAGVSRWIRPPHEYRGIHVPFKTRHIVSQYSSYVQERFFHPCLPDLKLQSHPPAGNTIILQQSVSGPLCLLLSLSVITILSLIAWHPLSFRPSATWR